MRELHPLGRDERDHAGELGDLDFLADAGGVAVAEGGEDRGGGHVGGDEVAEGDADAGGRAAGEAGDGVDAASGGHHVAEARHLRPRAAAAAAGHVDLDDARIGGAQVLVGEPHALDDAGAEVVEDDVAVDCEAAEEVAALGALRVDRGRELAGVGAVEPPAGDERGPRGWRDGAADGIHAAAGLDFDDLGAEVGEDARGEGAGKHPGDVEDADARERAGVASFSF